MNYNGYCEKYNLCHGSLIFTIVTLFLVLVQSGVSEAAVAKQTCYVQNDADYKIIGIQKPFQTVIFKHEKFGMICLCSPHQSDVIYPLSIDDEEFLANKIDLYLHRCMNERLYEIKKPKY